MLLLTDWLSEWDGERDLWHGPMRQASEKAIFAACQHTHTPMDVLPWRDDLTADDLACYELVFAPHVSLLPERMANVLKDYCSRGGKLIMGARTGYKTELGHCVTMPMPGYAADLCGVTVEEYSLPRADEFASLFWNGKIYPVTGFQEALAATDSRVLACYDSGWLADQPALCEKIYPNNGAAWYVGTGFSESLTCVLLDMAGVCAPWQQLISCPECVELAVRSDEKADWFFLINFSQDDVTVHIDPNLTPVIGNGDMLPGLGVSVWKRSK